MSRTRGSTSNRRRVAQAVLVVGAVSLAIYLGRSGPVDHELRLQFPPTSSPLCEINLAWVDTSDEELSGGARFSLSSGRPDRFLYSFRAPAGEYRLTVTLLRPRRGVTCNSTLLAAPMREVKLHLEGGYAVIHLSAAATP